MGRSEHGPAWALAMGLTLIACVPHRLAAQAPDSAEPPIETTVTLENLTRVETWRFFEPPEPEGNPDYTFIGNRAYLGVGVRAPRFDLAGGFAYTSLGPLPSNAVGGGGPMGTGALYQAATGMSTSYQLYLSELNLTLHSADRRVRFTFGRMAHASGAEGDRPADDARERELVGLRRLRLDSRLIGGFDWAMYRRRFDGVRLTIDRRAWYAGGALFAPTQGGFEESANLTMVELQVASAFAGRRHVLGRSAPTGRAETQAFTHVYRDRRDVTGRPDNTGLAAARADVTVTTMGGSNLGVRSARSGRADWLLWGAAQLGDWYGSPHRAWSLAGEGGYQWSAVAGRPWIRAGVSYASGDEDAADDRHGTFFPMLPTMRTYALSTVYAQMNLGDLFVQAIVEPHGRTRMRVDLHRLDLAETADHWYQGSGANALDGSGFGYAGRPARGASSLGTVLEGAIDVRIKPWWSVNAYAGRMWGGDLVRRLFVGDRLAFWYVENVFQFVGDADAQALRR